MTTVIKYEYQCSKCGETDYLKTFPNEGVPTILNCMTCGAGRGMDLKEMAATNTGIFLTGNKF